MRKFRRVYVPISGREDVKPIYCDTQEEISKATEHFLDSKCVVLISRNWDNSYFVEGIPEIGNPAVPK